MTDFLQMRVNVATTVMNGRSVIIKVLISGFSLVFRTDGRNCEVMAKEAEF